MQLFQEVGLCQPLQVLLQCLCLPWRRQFPGQLSLHWKLLGSCRMLQAA